MAGLNRAAGTSYDQDFKDTSTGASALPQKVILFTPVATAKVSGFSGYDQPHTITSLAEFYDLCGVCPGYFATRILRPINGGGIGTVPLIVYPIEDKSGASAAVGDIPRQLARLRLETEHIQLNLMAELTLTAGKQVTAL